MPHYRWTQRLNFLVKSDKDKYHDITYMYDSKNDTNELICKTKTDLENKFIVTKRESLGEG